MTYIPPVYPTTLPLFTEVWPVADDIDWMNTEKWDAMVKELRAALTELGLTPKGSYADVAARLDDLDGVFLTIDQSVTPQVTVGRFTFPYVDAKLGKTDGIYLEIVDWSVLGFTLPVVTSSDSLGAGYSAWKNGFFIGGVDADPYLGFASDDATIQSRLTYYSADDFLAFDAQFGSRNISGGDGIVDVMKFLHRPAIGNSTVGDGERLLFVNRREGPGAPGTDFNAGSIVSEVINNSEAIFGGDLVLYTSHDGVEDIECLRLSEDSADVNHYIGETVNLIETNDTGLSIGGAEAPSVVNAYLTKLIFNAEPAYADNHATMLSHGCYFDGTDFIRRNQYIPPLLVTMGGLGSGYTMGGVSNVLDQKNFRLARGLIGSDPDETFTPIDMLIINRDGHILLSSDLTIKYSTEQAHILGNVVVADETTLGSEQLTNSGAAGMTDWVDTDEDGVADDWEIRASDVTGSIITGSGFTGNAQRVDYTSVGMILRYAGPGGSGGSTLFKKNRIYRVSLKLRADCSVGLYVGSTYVGAGATTGDAALQHYYVKATSDGYFTISALSAAGFLEVDEVTIKELKGGDLIAANDIYANNGNIVTKTGYVDSKTGFKTDGTAPAADNTYANPTSITIKGGIITAIS